MKTNKAKGTARGAKKSCQAVVSVDPIRGSIAYDRMIFGQFIEHFHRQVYGGIYEPGSPLSDKRGFRTDVIEAMRELQVPVVRWPGGCYVSAHHWKDGVGPERRVAYDKAWRVEDSNAFGTDEFVAWCRAIGAEPYICTNAGSGTPEEMSDWVEYCNLDRLGYWARLRRSNGVARPHDVRYWSIGNENWGAHEIGAKKIGEWGRFVAESAKMMKRVDPSIRLFAAAVSGLDWISDLLREAGPYLDCISLHEYFDRSWERPTSDYATCMLACEKPEEIITQAEQILGACGYGHLGIAFDEWNLRGWHHPGGGGFEPSGHLPETIAARDKNDLNSVYTMADAVFSASFLNTCLRHARSIRMANMAPVINTRGPLYVHPGGIVRRPHFHVMQMYASLLQPRVADAFVRSDPFSHEGASVGALDAVVTCDEAMGRLTAVFINRDPERRVECRLLLGGKPCEQTVHATVLTGDSPDSFNDIPKPDRVAPVEREFRFANGVLTVPPHAIVICPLKAW